MTDAGSGKNGGAKDAAGSTPIPIQARVLNQYVKDLSFENPNIRKLMSGPGEPPNLKVEVNVNAERVDGDAYESAIQLRAAATNNIGTVYIFECVYAGLFKIENIPEQALEPFLLISAPMTLFPFLRRLVADVTREGGYPPLLLDPIDFAGLYFSRQDDIARNQETKLNA
jgi:preprotein translocase subunit SecB